MEAYQRHLWRQPDHIFFDTFELNLTLLSVLAETGLFFSLVEDHVADTLILRGQNTNPVRLVVEREFPLLLIIVVNVIADRRQGQVAVILAPQAELQGHQVVVPPLVLKRGHFLKPLARLIALHKLWQVGKKKSIVVFGLETVQFSFEEALTGQLRTCPLL